jgi:hypothetical protein
MSKKLSPSQVGAIENSRRIALELQEKFGEGLAFDRGDRRMTYAQIIQKYNLDKRYPRMGNEGLYSALTYAFLGYRDGDGSFEGLLPEDVADTVRVENIKKYTYPVSLGSIPEGRRREIAAKAGLVSYKNRVGIHGRSKETAMADSKKGGLNSVLSRGIAPWSEGETLLAYLVDCAGVYDKKGVCDFVNSVWENGRSVTAVKNQLCRFGKSYRGIEHFFKE